MPYIFHFFVSTSFAMTYLHHPPELRSNVDLGKVSVNWFLKVML
jgi:hypothetical protein